MKKGTMITEEQVRWSEDIGVYARQAAYNAAAAFAAKGNPLTDEEFERRARNAQDRDDLRDYANGGNLTGCKDMSRSELVAELNKQLQSGLYGTGSKAGFKAMKTIKERRETAPRRIAAKYAGTCPTCRTRFAVGAAVVFDPTSRMTTCAGCAR